MISKKINNKVFSFDCNDIITEKVISGNRYRYKIGIIIDSPVLIPPTTGVTYRLYYLSKALSELGYEQVWFIGNRNHQNMESINSLKNDHIKIHLIPPESIYDCKYLSELIKSERIDIIQFEISETLLAIAPNLKKLVNLPIILEAHDIEASLRKSLNMVDEVELMNFIQFTACSLADAVVSMTPNDYASLVNDISVPKHKIFLAPNGVNIDTQEHFTLDKKSTTLIFLGNMYYFPNQQGLIYTIEKVLPIVWEKTPNTILKVVGLVPDNIREKYENDHILFTGEVNDYDEFKRHLRSGIAGLCILFSGSGMKVKILDYCANGLPVILTETGLSGYEKNESFILVNDDASSIAQAIINILNNKERALSLGVQNRKFIMNNFSWDSICKKLIEAYDSVYNSYSHVKGEREIKLPKPLLFKEGRDEEISKKMHIVINKNDIEVIDENDELQ
ncbi:MAG: glycosyltransferase family 4 protein [Candidatus Pacebacteria bacterium]|nr:glycosyltransferase family 4 protein [Candidatus Paceibacterota bacterium]